VSLEGFRFSLYSSNRREKQIRYLVLSQTSEIVAILVLNKGVYRMSENVPPDSSSGLCCRRRNLVFSVSVDKSIWIDCCTNSTPITEVEKHDSSK